MGVNYFAAIEVGSYELEMKIFEIGEHGIKTIDSIRHVIELGRDTYIYKKISNKRIDELCDVLFQFTGIMKSYDIKHYRACATSAVREAENMEIVLDRIQVRTGIKVDVLSNSEQRFFCYKAVESTEKDFTNIIKKATAIVDVSAGSVQVSLFDKDALVTTQNLKIGSLRIREMLKDLARKYGNFNDLIEELIENDIETFKRIYLKDKEVKNIIAVGDYLAYFLSKTNTKGNCITRKEFMDIYEYYRKMAPEEIARNLKVPLEIAALVLPCILVYKKIIDYTDMEKMWVSNVRLCDGIVAEYAEQKGYIVPSHNFEEDIVAAARNIAKRYKCNKTHTEHLEVIALEIFDNMKNYHGLTCRDRLLLQIAVILHDCGKYISMTNPGESAYNIITSTEIIGLSHAERELVANIVRFNTVELTYNSGIRNDYLRLSKLTAILRVSNAMDRSHKQKFNHINISLEKNELLIETDTIEDIALEKSLLEPKADFFEELYGIRPVLKKKRR